MIESLFLHKSKKMIIRTFYCIVFFGKVFIFLLSCVSLHQSFKNYQNNFCLKFSIGNSVNKSYNVAILVTCLRPWQIGREESSARRAGTRQASNIKKHKFIDPTNARLQKSEHTRNLKSYVFYDMSVQ